MVIYPPGSSTTGWVAAAFIRLEGRELSSLPVVQSGAPALPLPTQPEPSPTANPYFATVQTTINVRGRAGSPRSSRWDSSKPARS